MAVFDLPAKSAATNTKQFNGEYGCFYCLDKGEVHNRARIYPSHASHNLRTTKNMKIWATVAEETGISQYGVKGKSALANHVDYPQCIPVDYMHSVLEGVFKQLMKRWFDAKFHDQPLVLEDPSKRLISLLPISNQLINYAGFQDLSTNCLFLKHRSINHGYFSIPFLFYQHFFLQNMFITWVY